MIISYCLQTFSLDFLGFFFERRHLKYLNKSANKLIKNKKFNGVLRKLQFRNMFLNIQLVKYKFFYNFCRHCLIIKKKVNSQNVNPNE